MKKILLLVSIFFVQNIFSQAKPSEAKKNEAVTLTVDAPAAIITEENKVYNTAGVDTRPEFPGGIEKLYEFIAQNYIIPKDKPVDVKGKVYVTFIIEKDGSLSEIKSIRDIGYGTGKEAIRVLASCPKWIPGKVNNNPVRVLYSMPISSNLK